MTQKRFSPEVVRSRQIYPPKGDGVPAGVVVATVLGVFFGTLLLAAVSMVIVVMKVKANARKMLDQALARLLLNACIHDGNGDINQSMDSNRDGKADETEFVSWAKENKITRQQSRILWKELDANHDNVLSLQEWDDYMDCRPHLKFLLTRMKEVRRGQFRSPEKKKNIRKVHPVPPPLSKQKSFTPQKTQVALAGPKVIAPQKHELPPNKHELPPTKIKSFTPQANELSLTGPKVGVSHEVIAPEKREAPETDVQKTITIQVPHGVPLIEPQKITTQTTEMPLTDEQTSIVSQTTEVTPTQTQPNTIPKKEFKLTKQRAITPSEQSVTEVHTVEITTEVHTVEITTT